MRNTYGVVRVDRPKIRIDAARGDGAHLAEGNGIRPILDTAHNRGRDRRISFELLPQMNAARPDISNTDGYFACQLALNRQIVLDIVWLAGLIVDRSHDVREIAAKD